MTTSARPSVSPERKRPEADTVCAALAWYDEPIEFLDRCVRSLADLADHLVAFDGAWDLFPHVDPISAPEQAETIREAARAIDLACVIRAEPLLWQSQIAKRSALMHEASLRAGWTFVIDGDEYVHDPRVESVRALLAESACDVATVLCHVTTGATAADRHRAPIRRIYRNPVTVEEGHNGYRTADGRWLHGDPTYVQLEQAVATPLELHHQFRDRSPERNRAASDYRAARRAAKPGGWL